MKNKKSFFYTNTESNLKKIFHRERIEFMCYTSKTVSLESKGFNVLFSRIYSKKPFR